MPIENIIKSQKQGKLFGYKLKEELNSNNKRFCRICWTIEKRLI
ncbi:hypothetical protein [Candidatus Tisiphia endosymbiont of Parasteatoda lunata]